MEQVRQDGLLPAPEPLEGLVRQFRQMGLSESAARTAAVGRGGSELDARRALRETATGAGRSDDRRDTQRRLDALGEGLRQLQESLRRLDRAGVTGRPVTGR
jgi:hypothetical protein